MQNNPLNTDLTILGSEARKAFKDISRTSTAVRNQTIKTLADHLEAGFETIQTANQVDIAAAEIDGLSAPLVDRLTLTDRKLANMVAELRLLADLPDPVGEVYDARTLDNGLRIHRQRVPLGVLGVIYESRPNVTIDVGALAIKTGNAAILRGGKETLHTNRVLIQVIHDALKAGGLPENTVQFVDSPDRELVGQMLRLNDFIDVIVPRGGSGLHEFCRKNATIPVITGGIGICHLFVDESADLEAAIPLIRNAKTQNPSVCNSLDTLLVHANIAAEFLPAVVNDLAGYGVLFRANPEAAVLVDHASVSDAAAGDFDIEWLSLTLGLKIVGGLDEALRHIDDHSTFHSDGILTQNTEIAERFVQAVDSAGVFVNASTRFNDGGQLGLGAEVAVSTQRLHARGPMGLPELTTYKWVVVGDYTSRA